jgi:Histidinol dehydrogenase
MNRLGESEIRIHTGAPSCRMKIFSYLDSGYLPFVRRLNRRAMPEPGTRDLVAQILSEVATTGDPALFTFTKRFDGATLTARNLFVSEAEFVAADKVVTAETKEAVARFRSQEYAQGLVGEKCRRRDGR